MKATAPRQWLPILLLAATPAAAQLHESVNVEGIYLHDIIRPDRINRLPGLQTYTLADSPLDYATEGLPADFTPAAPAIGPTAYGATRSGNTQRGYIDLSLGSYLASNLSAGVTALRADDSRLGLRMQFNSISGWYPGVKEAGKCKDYRGGLGIDVSHRFGDTGTLHADLQYNAGYFNYYGQSLYPALPIYYYGTNLNATQGEPEISPMPTQTLNDASFRIGWESPTSENLRWHTDIGARYFAYRTSTRETDIILDGGVSAAAGETGRAGIDARLDALLYNTAVSAGGDAVNPDGYVNILFTPYYDFTYRRLTLRAGFDLDLTFNADGDTGGSHFGAIHIAPDIRLGVAARNVGFYIDVLGGTNLQTLAAISQEDPYCNPLLQSTRPINSPLDARIGFETTPFAGFTAGAEVRYGIWRGVAGAGWFMATSTIVGENAYRDMLDGLPAGATPDFGKGYDRYNLSGFSATLRMSYRPSAIFTIAGEGTYSPQNGTTGTLNGLDRPRWTALASLELRPIRQLSLAVNYDFRGLRRIYTTYSKEGLTLPQPGGSDGTSDTAPGLAYCTLPNLHRLGGAITWHITPAIALGATADVTIGKGHDEILPAYTIPDIFAGRLSWIF